MVSSASFMAAGNGFSGERRYFTSITAWFDSCEMWLQKASSEPNAGKIIPLPWKFIRVGCGVDGDLLSFVYRFAVMVLPASRLGMFRVEWALLATGVARVSLNTLRRRFTVIRR